MISSSKFQCILLVLCVSYLAIVMASSGGEKTESVSRFSPATAGVNDVTCSVSQDKCGSECDRRCSNTQYRNACLEFCNKCCNKCLCVPPGTLGNKECCPCYNDWKTKEGGPKCP